jgi:hypothetical protein
VAISYFEWAGASYQQVIVPWTVIDGADGAIAFSERLARRPAGRSYYTSISGAIDFGVRLLADSKVEAARRVIDVSGDGANNDGRPVTLARDAAVAEGVVINGLPIMLKRGITTWDIDHLDQYYRDCVIGGPGSFLIPVRERTHFAEAIRAKIVREIVEDSREPLIRPAQAESRTNCLIGEHLRQQRGG